MNRLARMVLVSLIAAASATAQQAAQQALQQGQVNTLMQAQQALTTAEGAGAAITAKTLYDEALWRLKFAQENWSATKDDTREQSRMRALEALWAARAALAKAQWLGTNTAIRSLQEDIRRFGGRSDVTLLEESPTIEIHRGATSADRIATAQAAIDAAKAAGAEQLAGNDLKPAQENLETARKITRNNKQSASADHLAFVAEMIARRALYLARANETVRHMPGMQMERTRLASVASEQTAAAERAQREEAERRTAQLQQQLAAEQSNRQSQAEELEKLRQQLEETRRTNLERQEADRTARVQAERRLDELMRLYENAIATSNPAQTETLRRQVEDQQLALRAIQERERLNEQSMSAEIDGLRKELENARAQGTASAQVVSEREAELARRQAQLETMVKEREAAAASRTEMEQRHQAAIAESQRRRDEAEAQAQALRQQVETVQQQAQQTQAELDRARQQAQATQVELEKARQDLAQREAEARRTRMELELAKLASTRSDARGIIVTLPGIFFDTGKSALKPGAKNTLTKIATQLKGESAIRISVEGHTDSVGSEASNAKLSEARANAVRDFLLAAGMSADRISAAGKGEGEPVATNKTAAGRQQNRRVELVITQ